MNINYKIISQLNIAFVRFSDVIDDHILITCFKELYNNPSYNSVSRLLIDFTDIDKFLVTRNGIELLVNLDEEFSTSNTKYAIIVARNNLIYGYARMYQLLRDNGNDALKVVRSLDLALDEYSISLNDYPFHHNEFDGVV